LRGFFMISVCVIISRQPVASTQNGAHLGAPGLLPAKNPSMKRSINSLD